jgi:hypothetical protein
MGASPGFFTDESSLTRLPRFAIRFRKLATAAARPRLLRDFLFVIRLPRIQIQLGSGPEAAETYQWLTERHPRYPLFARKGIGVELIDLRRYLLFEEYLATVGGKHSTAYFRRRALRKGYSFGPINKNDHVEEIDAINTSARVRQGLPMEREYIKFHAKFPVEKNWLYLGIKDDQGRLVAYLDIHCVGELAYVGPILGHAAFLKDGIMYFLFAEAVRVLMDEKSVRYFMYDTYFGGRDGLRLFKKRIGFQPFRVRWRMNG